MIKVYRINTGSCGGCDLEIAAVVAASADLAWADSPADADVLLLTGPLTIGSRAAFMALWRSLGGQIPLLAIGRCAIDGHPFGRGGLAAAPEISARLKLDGCPPEPRAIAEAIRRAIEPRTTQRVPDQEPRAKS
ncbi:MAG TPA: NADH:ubiquinone oxidoreductase [Roseiflexaceae bacterium]